MRLVVASLAVVAGCWTASPAPPPKDPVHPTDPTAPAPDASDELHATLRIDAQPSGKKFQGVWLELADGTRYVVDYRARELWRGFEGAEVIATGHCYEPFGQAISARHFRVASLRFAAPPARSVPFRALGPEIVLTGELVAASYPAGSKLAGSSTTEFHAGGTVYQIAGADFAVRIGPATIKARTVERDPAYAAHVGGPTLWLASLHSGEPSRDRPRPCR